MSLVFVDGFDHYTTPQIPQKWTYVSGGGMTISTTGGRRGGGALYMTGNYVRKSLASNTKFTWGFSFRYTVQGSFPPNVIGQYLYDGVAQLTLLLEADGSVSVKRGDANGTYVGISTQYPFVLNSTNYVEFQAVFSNTAGSVIVRINSREYINVSNVDTCASTVEAANQIQFGLSQNTIADCPDGYVDDLYVTDGSGTTNTGFLGDVRVDTIFPNADGTYQDGVPSTGTTGWNLIDEVPPTTSDYVTLVNTGDQSSYDFTALPSFSELPFVYGLQVNSNLLKTNAGPRGETNMYISGGFVTYAASQAVTTTPQYSLSISEFSPDSGNAWTASEINSAQFGVRSEAS